MRAFNEANTVEAFVRDCLCGGITHHTAVGPGLARRHGQLSGLGWHRLAPQTLPRQPHEFHVEANLQAGRGWCKATVVGATVWAGGIEEFPGPRGSGEGIRYG